MSAKLSMSAPLLLGGILVLEKMKILSAFGPFERVEHLGLSSSHNLSLDFKL